MNNILDNTIEKLNDKECCICYEKINYWFDIYEFCTHLNGDICWKCMIKISDEKLNIKCPLCRRDFIIKEEKILFKIIDEYLNFYKNNLKKIILDFWRLDNDFKKKIFNFYDCWNYKYFYYSESDRELIKKMKVSFRNTKIKVI